MESKKVKDFKKEERMEKEREKIINDINKEIDKKNFMTQKELMEREVYYDLTGKTGRGADSRLWYATLYCGHTTHHYRFLMFLELVKKYWYYNNDNRHWLFYFTSEAIEKNEKS